MHAAYKEISHKIQPHNYKMTADFIEKKMHNKVKRQNIPLLQVSSASCTMGK